MINLKRKSLISFALLRSRIRAFSSMFTLRKLRWEEIVDFQQFIGHSSTLRFDCFVIMNLLISIDICASRSTPGRFFYIRI